MTILEIMIVLAILALVVGFVIGPKVYDYFQESKEETQRLTVQKYANEGFIHWARKHPTQGCPGSIAEIAEEMGRKDSKDLWGKELLMFCGDNLPPGVRGFAVMSLGPDGQQGTADDIKSWE
jgi:type II secretory pathway pseudopilin PulG